jgi:hypothetical protein
MSASEMIFLGWKTIRHIYKNDVSITIYGEEISPKKKFRYFSFKKKLLVRKFFEKSTVQVGGRRKFNFFKCDARNKNEMIKFLTLKIIERKDCN